MLQTRQHSNRMDSDCRSGAGCRYIPTPPPGYRTPLTSVTLLPGYTISSPNILPTGIHYSPLPPPPREQIAMLQSSFTRRTLLQRESIPVGCVPPGWKQYMLKVSGHNQMSWVSGLHCAHNQMPLAGESMEWGRYPTWPFRGGGGIDPTMWPISHDAFDVTLSPREQTGARENITLPQT